MTRTGWAFLAIVVAGPVVARAQEARVWTAAEIAALEKKIASAVDPSSHLGVERLLPTATLIYRDGPSEAEVHELLADFITVRSGEGEVLIGGTIVNPRATATDELRGSSIEGATRYTIAAGDMLYVPANTAHQFLVAPGKHFVVTIVKMPPIGTLPVPTAAAPQGDAPRNVARADTIYVADSESGPDTGARELTGIRKGIRIGSASDGTVTAFIEDMESTTAEHSGAEGVGVDAEGNVYGAVVRRQMLERHVRR